MTSTYVLRDTATMLRRNLRHQSRYLSLTLFQVMTPILLLLLFVYVFGGTMGLGLAGPTGGRNEYLEYIAPGIILITIASVAQGTAISVSTDMTEGIIARFRTMAIPRVAILSGHVAASFLQTMVAVVAVTAVALLLGFRPTAGLLQWLAAGVLVAGVTLGIVWLAVAMGLNAKTVESASNVPMLLILLPFLSSGFVPTETLPTGLGWFAEYQPFTVFTELLRDLLTGRPTGSTGVAAAAWCAALAGCGYLWSRHVFNRDPRH